MGLKLPPPWDLVELYSEHLLYLAVLNNYDLDGGPPLVLILVGKNPRLYRMLGSFQPVCQSSYLEIFLDHYHLVFNFYPYIFS